MKGDGLKGGNSSLLLHATMLGMDEEMMEFMYQGCTATIVVVWKYNEQLYLQVANLGDSACFLRMGDGVVKLTRDHKLTVEEERERIIEAGILLNPTQTRIEGGLVVSRALGDHYTKDKKSGMIAVPYICEPVALTKENNILVLASDGLWDVMSGEKAINILKKQEHSITAKEGAKALMQSALRHKECNDNVTVIVVTL